MSAPVSPEEYGSGLDDEGLRAAGWSTGLDIWGLVSSAYGWMLLGGSTPDHLRNSQLWSLRQAIRAEYRTELAQQDGSARPPGAAQDGPESSGGTSTHPRPDDTVLGCGECYDIAHDEMDERETCDDHCSCLTVDVTPDPLLSQIVGETRGTRLG